MIVGIGASAGGLNAFKSFLGSMPADSGMAFVLIQHLSPDHPSMLSDLLARATAMPVVEAEDGMPVEPNRVFVIPPDTTLTLKDRCLQISRPAPPRERRRPIDTFFSSLADDQGENAVCIVLAGTGTDGTLGLKTVKENGGLTMAQAELDHTAMSGMPHSAAETGLVDHVLPAGEMPAKLLEYRDHLHHVAGRKDVDGTRTDTAEHLAAITALLRGKTGHDFSKYKEKTVVRRIQRRMQVLQIGTVPDYIARLREEPRQIDLLFRELLIGVTQFFRDAEAFDALRRAAITAPVEGKGPDDVIRIWIPGCATGEEVYSIAILLKEEMERQGRAPKVQIFGTDIDDMAVAFARSGRYRKTTGVSAERLKRWFAEDNDEFCPVREIREMCVFSVHSVAKDPPFSKLDLISCRNLLIYMDPVLQERVMRMFHYALRPGGMLFLGPSEGVGRQGKLFAAIDKKHRIFRRTDADATFPTLPPPGSAIQPSAPIGGAPTVQAGEDRIDKSARRALAKYSLAYLVIDQHHNIMRFSGGEAGRYLEPSPGAASLSLFANLRKSLRPVVRAALAAALATRDAARDNATIRIDGRSHALTVIVEPISAGDGEEVLFVVAFREGALAKAGHPGTAKDDHELLAVEHELRTTRAQLRATIDELETANEEMKSATEEYQSINEELQSSNEELETSKEEMQSINEELQTVNTELNAKNDLLTHVNSDLKNLLDSTQIATIFLDTGLRIKNFTPGMTDIFRLREGDRGRPITEIVTRLGYHDIEADVATVLRNLAVIEREVGDKNAGTAFIMRIRPYRTVDNVIDGVVITFIDISEHKRAENALRASEGRFSAIVGQATVGVAETGLDGRFLLTNARYRQIVGRSAEELQGLRMQDITHPDDLSHDAELFERLVAQAEAFQVETRYVRPDGTSVWVHNNVAPLVEYDGKPHHVLTVTLDIAERKRADEQTALLLGELDHRVKNILAVVSAVITQTLKNSATPGAFAAAVEGRVAAIARAHGVLTHGGVGEGSLHELVATELAPYERKGHISITGDDVRVTPRAGLALALAIHELASNAAKYGALSTAAGHVAVSWKVVDTAGPLQFEWIEKGGPPIVAPPPQRGFGTALIERTLSHQFDATVSREFLPSGLRCTITIPMTPEVFRTQSGQG